MIFEDATSADYPAILELNQAAIPEVSHLDEAALTALHQQAVLLTVARSGEKLAGFMLILKEGAEYGSVNYQYFAENYHAFHYVDRIVVGEPFRRQGVGAALYRILFEAAASSPRVTCEVNLQPPNPASVQFHQTLGFVIVGEQETDGGKKRVALMVREAGCTEDQPGHS